MHFFAMLARNALSSTQSAVGKPKFRMTKAHAKGSPNVGDTTLSFFVIEKKWRGCDKKRTGRGSGRRRFPFSLRCAGIDPKQHVDCS